MKALWIGLGMALLIGTAHASMTTAQSPITCSDYKGGESDLKPDQAALIPDGGVLTICRQEGKSEPVSYSSVSKAILGPRSICRMTKSGTVHAAIAQNGVCPPSNDAAYCQLLNNASDDDFLNARQIFEKMAQGGGIVWQQDGKTLATFEALKVEGPSLFSVKRADDGVGASTSIILEVRPLGRDFMGHLLTFMVVDGQFQLSDFVTWMA